MPNTTTNSEYQELVEAIIVKMSTILGKPVAIKRARNVPGMEVDDTGKVTAMPGNANQMLADLVEQYKSLSGSVGHDFCKQAAASWSNTHTSITLPPILL